VTLNNNFVPMHKSSKRGQDQMVEVAHRRTDSICYRKLRIFLCRSNQGCSGYTINSKGSHIIGWSAFRFVCRRIERGNDDVERFTGWNGLLYRLFSDVRHQEMGAKKKGKLTVSWNCHLYRKLV